MGTNIKREKFEKKKKDDKKKEKGKIIKVLFCLKERKLNC